MRFQKPSFAILSLATALFCGLIHVNASEVTIETLIELDQRPGNPAIASDGTIYFSMHPVDSPKYSVMQLVEGEAIPFPSEEASRRFAAVIGIAVDAKDDVWILDMGGEGKSPQLSCWDGGDHDLKQVIYLPKETLVDNSFAQDFAIDEKRQVAYIADMGRGDLIGESRPAILVVDLQTGQVDRRLEAAPPLQPKEGATMIVEGRPLAYTNADGEEHPIELGLNPIAIDAQNEWVYFSTINAGPIYRIRSADLANPDSNDDVLMEGIESFADKPTSDGIAADGRGQVFITNLEASAISVGDANGSRIYAQDESLIWPDGIALASDGSLIVTVNQLHKAGLFNGEKEKGAPPYRIVRIW